MRLIDADALKAVFEEKSSEAVCGVELCKAIISRIDEAPTVDAVPVRHGRWVWNDYGGFGNYHCSECRKICICNGDYDYCPNCGARMDEDEQEIL